MRTLLVIMTMLFFLAGCQTSGPTVTQERQLNRYYDKQLQTKVPTESLKAVRAI